MGGHLWTPEERRAHLGAILRHARWIRKKYRTDAYDDIIATCERFRRVGFSEDELKAFGRSIGSPPGWVHPRGDGYHDFAQAHPQLLDHLERLKELFEDLRTIGYREE